MDKQPLNIQRPPDFVFKYRKRSRVAPAQEVIVPQGIFDFIGVKYPPIYRESDEFFQTNGLKREWFKYPVVFADGQIFVHTESPPLTEEEEKMGGQLACFKDCPFPFKGHPFPEALFSVNVAKRFTRQLLEVFSKKDILWFIGLFFLFPKKKKIALAERLLTVYTDSCRRLMDTYILEKRFMSKYGQEIYDLIFRCLFFWGLKKEVSEAVAEIVASLVDWDNAYWMRVGDTFAETTKEELLKSPIKTLRRLGRLTVRRNPTDPLTAGRFNKALKLASLALLIPNYRRIFKKAMKMSNFGNFQFDRADKYHSWVYADYDYLGLPLAKRLEMYDNYHKEHPPFPPRMTISPQ